MKKPFGLCPRCEAGNNLLMDLVRDGWNECEIRLEHQWFVCFSCWFDCPTMKI